MTSLSRTMQKLRPVYVIGVGWHPYQRASSTPYVALGLKAIREALAYAGIAFTSVQSAYVATALLPMAAGRPMLRHLGASGLPITHIEDASASGSAAFRQACIEVGSGVSDVVLAVGVDKPTSLAWAIKHTGIDSLADELIAPATHFALLAEEYAARNGASAADIAHVAVKNHRNGSLNPNAQRQKARSLEEILGGTSVSGSLTALQCCPVGEGAAAVIVASLEGMKLAGFPVDRAVRVIGSAARSQKVYADNSRYDSQITAETARLAFDDAGVSPRDLHVVELHDAFAIEELEYLEAMGVCNDGAALHELKSGVFDVGGRCAVSTSGGLIAMGHPIGPTGLGQIGELAMQLRGEAGSRQQPSAKTGLAHMVGLGAVCFVHILQKA